MSLDDFLIPGEHVKQKIQQGGNAFYATNKRVIKYSKKVFGLFGEEFDDLAYKHITSVSLVNRPRWGWVYFGILLMIIGGAGVIWFASPEFVEFLDTDSQTILEYVSYGVIGFGLIVALLSFIFRESSYQFRAAGIKPEDWKIENAKDIGATDFVRTVREYLNQ